MISVIEATYIDFNSSKSLLGFESVSQCPRCKTSLIPTPIHAALFIPKVPKPRRDHPSTAILNYCPQCQNCFITTYNARNTGSVERGIPLFETVNEGNSEPIFFCGSTFSDYISKLSPKFIEIYNQSENAEAINLNQISGMGYRKALEFLIKDFAIHFNPDKRDSIESISLMNCIKTYIDNPKIQTLAEKSAWLGNDETHYTKKHADRDVSDLKIFINACVGFIDSELAVEDANTIEKV